MAQILVFGDSIAWGAWDREGGWVTRLRKFLDEKTLSVPEFWNTDYFMVYNLGISGDTSKWLLDRFEPEVKQMSKEKERNIIIFAIGSNDSDIILNKNKNFVPPEQFKDNINQLINSAKKYSSIIIFAGLTPADETKTIPIPWNDNISCNNKYIKQYNEIIKSVCVENKVRFINIYEKFAKTDYKKLLEDGLHPNSEGHKMIFEIVKDFLVKEKII